MFWYLKKQICSNSENQSTFFLDTLYVTLPNNEGQTSLHFAVEKNRFEVINFLLENFRDATDEDNNTFLNASLDALNPSCYDLKFVKLLVEDAKDAQTYVNVPNKYGEIALHKAARLGSFKVVKYLLECSSDVNATDDFNNTPLHLAAESGDVKSVKILLSYSGMVPFKDGHEGFWIFLKLGNQ